jgi:hypothetical protein
MVWLRKMVVLLVGGCGIDMDMLLSCACLSLTTQAILLAKK